MQARGRGGGGRRTRRALLAPFFAAAAVSLARWQLHHNVLHHLLVPTRGHSGRRGLPGATVDAEQPILQPPHLAHLALAEPFSLFLAAIVSAALAACAAAVAPAAQTVDLMRDRVRHRDEVPVVGQGHGGGRGGSVPARREQGTQLKVHNWDAQRATGPSQEGGGGKGLASGLMLPCPIVLPRYHIEGVRRLAGCFTPTRVCGICNAPAVSPPMSPMMAN